MFLRCDDLWREPEKQEKFLHVLVEAVRANHQDDLRASTQKVNFFTPPLPKFLDWLQLVGKKKSKNMRA